jgi:hypothetical protein
MEFATEFLFDAATAVVNDRLKNPRLRRTAFHIAGSSRALNYGQHMRFHSAVSEAGLGNQSRPPVLLTGVP